MDEKDLHVNAYNASFWGAWHFLKNPFLWDRSILFSLVSWIFLGGVFVLILVWQWPEIEPIFINYIWGIFSAFCFALFTALLIWAFVLPAFLDIAFEKTIRKFIKSQGKKISEEKHPSVRSGFYVVYKTYLWRFSWLFGSFVTAIIAPPISICISIIGIAHIAIIDAADLTLTILGFSREERIGAIRERDTWFLLGGTVGGAISLFLLPTLIGWIIWLPSMYIGTALWCLNWDIEPTPIEE